MTGKASRWDTLHPGRGGRPAAPPEPQEAARAAVLDEIAKIGDRPDADPEFTRMFDRIVRFL